MKNVGMEKMLESKKCKYIYTFIGYEIGFLSLIFSILDTWVSHYYLPQPPSFLHCLLFNAN